MVSNHAAVNPALRQEFLQLVYRLRTTDSSVTFIESVLQLSVKFPNCRRWLSWWLQPSVSSMIFTYDSKKKAELAKHPMRTSNSIESFHGVLYTTMNVKTSMPLATRQLLQVLKDGQDSQNVYFDLGITPAYGSKERRKISKRLVNFYQESDSRAPDNTEALLGDDNSQLNKRKRRQEAAEAKYFDDIQQSSQSRKLARKDIANYDLSNADATAMAQEDLDNALDKAIRCEQDLGYESYVKETLFYKSLADRADVTAEDLDECIPEELQMLLQEPEKQHADDVLPASPDSDIFSFDLSAEDILMIDDLVSPFNDKELEPSYHELLLNPNNSNSCYIDGPIELLLRCIFPYAKKSLLAQHDPGNQFDTVLFNAFRHYEQGKSMAGNQIVREFAWQHSDGLFVKGEMNDAYAFFSWLLEGASPQLRALFSLENVYQFNLCRHDEEDMSINNRSLQSLPFIKSYPTMKQYKLAEQVKDKKKQEAEITRLDNLFCQSFSQLLRQLREPSICVRCNQKCAIRCNLITEESLLHFF